MSFDPVSAIADLIKTTVDKVIPDAGKAAEARAKVDEMIVSGEIQARVGQLDINKEEAKSTNWFIAGGRPFVMWTCGISLAYVSIIEPLARFVATVIFRYSGAFPAIDTSLTMQVLLGLLGLAGMRTYEKSKNVEGNR